MEYITHAEKIEVEAAFPRPETRYRGRCTIKKPPRSSGAVFYKSLIVFSLQLEVGLGMGADRTDLRRRGTHVDVSAVEHCQIISPSREKTSPPSTLASSRR